MVKSSAVTRRPREKPRKVERGEILRHFSIKLPYVGSPKPEAEWLLNGEPLNTSSEGISVSFDCGNAKLEIDEITTSLQVSTVGSSPDLFVMKLCGLKLRRSNSEREE